MTGDLFSISGGRMKMTTRAGKIRRGGRRAAEDRDGWGYFSFFNFFFLF
jgi:hypothetical protein